MQNTGLVCHAANGPIPFELHLTAAVLALDDVPRFLALCK